MALIKILLYMKITTHFLGIGLLCVSLIAGTTSCKKDDSKPDKTQQLVGTYLGDYAETTDGSTVTVDDVETVVTKKSATEIKVNIQVIPGLGGVVFDADMTDETHFTVPKFTLNDDELEGTGSLTGTTLDVALTKVGAATGSASFTGAKQ